MPKAKKEGSSWRTVMRRSKTVTSAKVAKRLRDQALEMRRAERAAKAGRHDHIVKARVRADIIPEQTKTVPNIGFEALLGPARDGETGSINCGTGGIKWGRVDARYMPPDTPIPPFNTEASGDAGANEDLVTPFDAAFQGIMKAAEAEDGEAVEKLLRDFALYHRNDMERGHIETLKKVHEANAANVVRSYMAMIDGLGHANGGPMPPYVVIPGIMAVRVYDALRKAGHTVEPE